MKTIFTLIFHFSFFTINAYSQAVGIGTSSPSDALHVVGAANDYPLRVQVGTATKLRVLNNGGTTLGANNVTGTPANGLYVDGNTGLGASNPTDRLSVNGDINTTGEIKTNGTSGEAGQILQSNGNGTMTWADPCGYNNFREFFNPSITQYFWKVPTDVTDIMVEMWGAGGGGSENFGGGGGGYIKFKRTVIPGDTLFFTIGKGGEGLSIGGAATSGTATVFPSGNGSLNNSAGGGSSGITGLGGTCSITSSTLNSSLRLRGSHGRPRDFTFYQISSTAYAQKIIYGEGGLSGYNHELSGYGAVACDNTTNGSTIFRHSGRAGNQPGGGGGGGDNHVNGLTSGGDGGDGYLIIYW